MEIIIKTMLKLMDGDNEIKVVNDQIGSMTSALNLANACWEIIKTNEDYSLRDLSMPPILHWSDEGIISWYQFAIAIRNIIEESGF